MKRMLGTGTSLVGLAAATVLTWFATATARSGLTGGRPDAQITAIAGYALPAALLWLTALVALIAIEPLAGRSLTARLGCPPALRRLLLAGCGVSAAVAFAGTAQAVPNASPDPHRPALVSIQDRLIGLPLPDRPVDGAEFVTRPTTIAVGTDYEVRPGDTLWAIARSRLGPSATDAAVQTAWQRIYAANRAVIGADPSLIRPGQRLTLPEHLTRPVSVGTQKGQS